jgi:hypothetical protein
MGAAPGPASLATTVSSVNVKASAREARSSRPARFAARTGFAVNGLLHAVIGVLAITVAAGGGNDADQSAALQRISATPGGVVVLWAVTIGLAALGLWLIVGAFLLAPRDPKKRVIHLVVEAGKGAAYLAVAVGALSFALGSGSGGATETASMSARLLAAPGGVFVVFLIGALVLGIGVYFAIKGVSRGFTRDIGVPSGRKGTAVVALGVWGYLSKGIALAIVGILFIVAAVNLDPTKATGLDGGLKYLLSLPFGPGILIAVGAGFVAYGLYGFVRARIARL